MSILSYFRRARLSASEASLVNQTTPTAAFNSFWINTRREGLDNCLYRFESTAPGSWRAIRLVQRLLRHQTWSLYSRDRSRISQQIARVAIDRACRAHRHLSYILVRCNRAMETQEVDISAAIQRAGLRLGFSSLRPQQTSAIASFLKGKDVFVSLPTGSGKSLCFATLPLAFEELYGRKGSIVIIVSPLISLMNDQVWFIKYR